MVWIIILAFLGFAIYMYYKHVCCEEEEHGDSSGVIVLTIGVLIITTSFFVGWQKKVEELNIAPTTINNKLVKIEEMRKTYYTPTESFVSIDTVNKDLAVTTNLEIIELEKYINKHNINLAKWKVAYRNRFLFSTCFFKPKNTQPLHLKDFLRERDVYEVSN